MLSVNGQVGSVALNGLAQGVTAPSGTVELPATVEPFSLTTAGFDQAGNNALYAALKKASSVVLPSTLTDLKSIQVHPDNLAYASADGVLLDKSGRTLVRVPRGKDLGDHYTVPDGVEQVGDYAMSILSVTRITLPDSVRSLGAECFHGTRLKQLIGAAPLWPWACLLALSACLLGLTARRRTA